MALECAQGMNYLHSQAPPILHRGEDRSLSETYLCHAAHSFGGIDLKSPNLLLEASQGQLKVCDFGLSVRDSCAKEREGSAQVDESVEIDIVNSEEYGGIARDAHGVGSVPWMAPEMVDENVRVDAKVDVYSYGVVLGGRNARCAFTSRVH